VPQQQQTSKKKAAAAQPDGPGANAAKGRIPAWSHPRDRLLETATELFYAQGVHAVGIDKIIAFAGVAKATFYAYFPGKDDLVRAYVEDQSRQHKELAAGNVKGSPRETLLAIFEYMGVVAGSPAYRGCPFVNVAAEYPDPAHMVRMAVAAHRAWLRDHFRDLLVDDGHPDPERTADVLMLVRDGLVIGLDLGDTAAIQNLIRDAVTRVLDAQRA
jgi:AcrR family transcriptional regulator